MELRDLNGGFPEPPPGDPVRVVRAAHPACGGEARIRLPGYVPSRAVRRAVCGRCEQSFACERVEELDVAVAPPAVEASTAPAAPAAEAPRARRPKLPPPHAPVWRWLGIPVAAALVIAALVFLQGKEDASPPVAVAPQEPESPSGAPGGSGQARFVTEPGFSLALPPGWEATDQQGGAAFTAAASDGTADATLWIENAPGLSFSEFEARSLDQLRSLTGNAEVIERIAAPNTAGTVIRLRADTPEGSGVSAPYDVTLRAAGPYRYYLATTVQPDASVQAREGADLIHGSFVPELHEGGGRVQTGAAPGSEEGAP